MNTEQKSINDIISELQFEDIKQEDLAFDCIEENSQNQNILEVLLLRELLFLLKPFFKKHPDSQGLKFFNLLIRESADIQ